MIQAIRELNLRPVYSVNLFEKKSLFTTQTSFNVTDGSGTYAPSENVQYNEFYSAFISSGTYNSNDFTFNFGDNYDVVAPQTGNYIFSWRFNNINFTSGFYVPFEYEIKVFRNGLLSETIFGQHIGNYQENAKKWNTYCQSFYAEAGEIISFTFTIKADISYPYSVMNFFMGGLKLEYDDRYLGVPSMYSLPKGVISMDSGWNDVTDIVNTQSLTANRDNLIQITTAKESNGNLQLLDSNAKITPTKLNDSIVVDFAFSFSTPSGTNNYLNIYLKVNGIIYRAHTHAMLRSTGVTDYVSVSFNLPVKTDLFENGAEFYVNPSTSISITNRYIQVTKIHNGI